MLNSSCLCGIYLDNLMTMLCSDFEFNHMTNKITSL